MNLNHGRCLLHNRYPTRNEVESANSTRLERLPGPNRNYKALDAPGRDERGREYPPERVERALKDMIVPKQLPLKEGAQVMLVKVRTPGSSDRLLSRRCEFTPFVPSGHRTSSKASL